jgi:hypothetical protein
LFTLASTSGPDTTSAMPELAVARTYFFWRAAVEEKKMPVSTTCEFCCKEFKSRQAKYVHRLHHCPVKRAREAAETKRRIDVLQIELATVRQQLDAAVQAGVNAAGPPHHPHAAVDVVAAEGTTNITTTNSGNGNTTNNVTTIRINNFRAVDATYIAHEVVAEMIKSGDLRAALQEMVELLHYNPAHPENMNAYLADPLHPHGMCYRGGKWQKQDRDELAKLVMFNAAQVMNEHNDEPYSKDFTKKQTAQFDKFYDVIGYDKHPLGETIGTMARNRDLMEKTYPVLGSQ